VGVPGDDVDACVVHLRALKPILGLPVHHECFRKVTGDLGVTRALADFHGYNKSSIALFLSINDYDFNSMPELLEKM